MRIWTVANQKGGVGKTTTVVSLAGLCASRGERTLMVDLDPHGSLTSYCGLDPERVEPSVYDVFRDGAPAAAGLIRETGVGNLSLMPASTALATLDRQLGARQGMGLMLKRALATQADQVDQVLLDCPPMLGVLMVNALAASDRLIIPVQTEFLALKGLERMLHTLEMIRHSRSLSLPYLIVPTMYDQRTRASCDSLATLRAQYPERLWRGVIPEDTQFREASRRGTPLTVLRPWERGSQAYRRLLAALEEGSAAPAPMAEAVGHE